MRHFMDMCEATLYRGDSVPVSVYDISKTDKYGLFGRGVYLTDQASVANDYTIKKGPEIIFEPSNKARSEKQLVHAYLMHIISTRFAWDEVISKIREKWRNQYHDNKISVEQATDGFNKEVKALSQKLLTKAKQVFREERASMRVLVKTTGDYLFVSNNRQGKLTTFDIPEEYLQKTVDGDAPLPDDVLKIIRDLIVAPPRSPSQILDFRDNNHERKTFDDWLDIYKKVPVRYAWETFTVGGDGSNPSLDVIRNGTHSGSDLFMNDDFENQFIQAMLSHGYVGIRFAGGVEHGQHIRGGGGIKHTSYCLWDVDAIHEFRKESLAVSDQEPSSGIEKGIRISKPLDRI